MDFPVNPVLHHRYSTQVALGLIREDPGQRAALSALQPWVDALALPQKKRLFPDFFSFFTGSSSLPPTQGVYLWGNVGRGKSMLMDLFFDAAPIAAKRRVHFHAFMQEIHRDIHNLRQQKNYAGAPVTALANGIASDTKLLCFDELQAHDVADATLLYRLFSALFQAGVMIVSTSNHPPASLYTGGHQKERFAKFIALLESRMQVFALSSPTDYRLAQEKSRQQRYFYPLGVRTDQAIASLLSGYSKTSDTFEVQSRKLEFVRYGDAIGSFTFENLCEQPLGAADYLMIAKQLKTVIVTGIPGMTPEQRNEAKRFTHLIDALYEHKTLLIATASVPIREIYPEGDGAFEFQRTLSRLIEMQSQRYAA